MTESISKAAEKVKAGFGKKEQDPKSPLKKEGFLVKNRFIFLAFLVPFSLLLFGFAVSEFFPFGDNQIMVIDMWHQYYPFFNDMQEKLQTGGNMLYSWNGGLGVNFIAQMAYYFSSPLNLLCIFFPQQFLTECLALIVLLKIGFAGAFFAIYLRGLFKRCNLSTVTFATLYALCAFAMGYYWCYMWLDVLALLPLAILGLHKLVEEKKFRMFSLSVAFIMIGNYYIGVMACGFIALYYPIVYFSRMDNRNVKHFIMTTLRVLLFAIIGVAMAAYILIPTYLSMQNTYYISGKLPAQASFYNPIMDTISNLLPNVKLTYRGGLPNVYCGLISAMLGVLFLVCKKIPVRIKIMNVCLLGFLILSFNYNKLDFIWHGMHFPNELPFRYSFCFSFILITMAYTAFTYLKDITPGQIGAVAGGGFLYIILAEKLYKDVFDYKVIYISLLLLLIYSVILAIFKGKYRWSQSLACILLFLTVFGEMANYTSESVKAVGHSGRTTYREHRDDIIGLKEDILKKDNSFYRMEMASNFTVNDPALYTYRGVSQFSSEINAKVSTLMQDIGLEADPGSNSFQYALSSPVINSLLNVKYIMTRQGKADDAALTQIGKRGSSYSYENKYDLAIAYMASPAVRQWITKSSNPFYVQNNFVNTATDVQSDVFTEMIPQAEISGGNVSVGAYQNGYFSCSPNDANATSSVQITYVSPKEQSVYAYIASQGAESISAKRENGDTINFAANRGGVLSLGRCSAGEKITIDISYKKGEASRITSLVYALNDAEWEKAYAQLDDETLKVSEYSDTGIKGKITASKDGVMMTSIPYEKGWTVKVDGKKVDIEPISEAFISIDLKKGEHTIEFSYIPAGFMLGVLISVGSLGLLILLFIFLKRKEREKFAREAKKLAMSRDMGGFEIGAALNDTEQQAFDGVLDPNASADEIQMPSSFEEEYAAADPSQMAFDLPNEPDGTAGEPDNSSEPFFGGQNSAEQQNEESPFFGQSAPEETPDLPAENPENHPMTDPADETPLTPSQPKPKDPDDWDDIII